MSISPLAPSILNTTRIYQASEKDAKDIAELVTRKFQDVKSRLDTAIRTSLDDVLKDLAANSGKAWYCMRLSDANQLVATGQLSYRFKDQEEGEEVGYLSMLVSATKGAGIGAKLMLAIEQECKTTRMSLDCMADLVFYYARYGYYPTGHTFPHDNTFLKPEFHYKILCFEMEKNLRALVKSVAASPFSTLQTVILGTKNKDFYSKPFRALIPTSKRLRKDNDVELLRCVRALPKQQNTFILALLQSTSKEALPAQKSPPLAITWKADPENAAGQAFTVATHKPRLSLVGHFEMMRCTASLPKPLEMPRQYAGRLIPSILNICNEQQLDEILSMLDRPKPSTPTAGYRAPHNNDNRYLAIPSAVAYLGAGIERSEDEDDTVSSASPKAAVSLSKHCSSQVTFIISARFSNTPVKPAQLPVMAASSSSGSQGCTIEVIA